MNPWGAPSWGLILGQKVQNNFAPQKKVQINFTLHFLFSKCRLSFQQKKYHSFSFSGTKKYTQISTCGWGHKNAHKAKKKGSRHTNHI